MLSTLSHLSESSKLFIKKTPLAGTLLNVTFLRETWRKCIGNCSKHTVQAI